MAKARTKPGSAPGAAPDKTADNGRQPNGRFAKGNSGGPGRPRGYDFRRIITEVVGEQQVAQDILAIYRSLQKRAATAFDVAAAKLLLEKLCTADPIDVNLNEDVSMDEVAKEVVAMLSAARARKAKAGQ